MGEDRSKEMTDERKTDLEFIEISDQIPLDPEWGEFATFIVKRTERSPEENIPGSRFKGLNQ
jgi:hypothetical protein